jgi:YjbR
VTAEDFHRIALSMTGSSEGAHMRHPDFRVRGKIFATLGYPSEGWGMVKLTPEQQRAFVQTDPAAFAPVKGAWGEKGCTNVRLPAAREELVHEALLAACRNIPEETAARRKPSRKR